MTLSLQDVYAANILDTVRQPLLLLSADLRVVTANPAFYDLSLDVGRSYDLGASSFVTKPVAFEALVGVMKTIGQYWFEVVELPEP